MPTSGAPRVADTLGLSIVQAGYTVQNIALFSIPPGSPSSPGGQIFLSSLLQPTTLILTLVTETNFEENNAFSFIFDYYFSPVRLDIPAKSGSSSGGSSPLTQSISFGSLPSRTLGSGSFQVSATGGSSGNPVVFTSQTTTVCSTSGTNGSTINLLSVGTCIIAANQAGNASYNTASQVTQSFSITSTTVTIDDHGNSAAAATTIQPNSTTAGSIQPAGDQDWFKVSLPSAGTWTISATGSTDTYGYTYLADGLTIQGSNDDDGGTGNFRITETVSGAVTRYVRVNHYSSTGTGSYVLVSQFVASPATSGGTLPDLVVSALTITSTGLIGRTVTMTATVLNNGAATADASQLRFYFRAGQSTTLASAFCNTPSLVAGQSKTCSGDASIPSTLTPGVYDFVAVADYLGVVTESNEANNTLSKPITLSTPNTPNYTDLWWSGQAENGWGMTVNQHGDIQVNILFIYDSTGKPQWVIMPGGNWNSTFTTYSGDLYIPTGRSQ